MIRVNLQGFLDHSWDREGQVPIYLKLLNEEHSGKRENPLHYRHRINQQTVFGVKYPKRAEVELAGMNGVLSGDSSRLLSRPTCCSSHVRHFATIILQSCPLFSPKRYCQPFILPIERRTHCRNHRTTTTTRFRH